MKNNTCELSGCLQKLTLVSVAGICSAPLLRVWSHFARWEPRTKTEWGIAAILALSPSRYVQSRNLPSGCKTKSSHRTGYCTTQRELRYIYSRLEWDAVWVIDGRRFTKAGAADDHRLSGALAGFATLQAGLKLSDFMVSLSPITQWAAESLIDSGESMVPQSSKQQIIVRTTAFFVLFVWTTITGNRRYLL